MTDSFDSVAGQDRAVAQLRAATAAPVHAYLLSGPPGVGMRAAARAFSAGLVCEARGCADCHECRRALEEIHPDVVWVDRVGASISKEQIDEVLRVALRAPTDGKRTVIVLTDFHLVAQQYPRLLKTLDEPPVTTVFVLLADDVPPELVTVASRCVRIEFGELAADVIAAGLRADGVPDELADEIAAAAGGRLDRARLLVDDPGFRERRAAWLDVPNALDGTGAPVVVLADELKSSIDSVLEPLAARQDRERVELEARIEQTGERGAGRREMEDRHKREQRRVRTDELRFGLATLAAAYRDRLQNASTASDRAHCAAATAAVQDAARALVRNPNEALLLQGLFAQLSPDT
ncbi:MAG: hypothetical protein ACR2H3_15720 [Acidimicrobiales bacterium]